MSSQDQKAQVRARFGEFAQGYVNSPAHAAGPDIERLLVLAGPQPDWRMLDVATGGGHTALAFAPHVRTVVAADLTPRMLYAARDHARRRGSENILFCAVDAEQLSFQANTFDLITCRIAPHHFADVFRFMQGCYRCLRPGGVVLVQDHVMPEDPRAARYCDAFERLRDPSHVRALTEAEWQGVFLDAGLEVLHTETLSKRHPLLEWAARQGCTPEVVERLQVMLLQAPSAARAWLQPEYAGTPYASFTNHHVIIQGRKAA